jgi:hypothetical protein
MSGKVPEQQRATTTYLKYLNEKPPLSRARASSVPSAGVYEACTRRVRGVYEACVRRVCDASSAPYAGVYEAWTRHVNTRVRGVYVC